MLYQIDPTFDAAQLVKEGKAVGKPLLAIVEYVFGTTLLNVYLVRFKSVLRVAMGLVARPHDDKEINEEGRNFTEKLLLHREVGVELVRVDEAGNIIARIHHPAGDIACELVKKGLAKVLPVAVQSYDNPGYLKSLKDAQAVA